MVFGFGGPTPYKGQKYAELKKQAQESGHPFIDQEFPPDEKALFKSGGKLSGIEWKRPKQICDNPKLFVEGVSSGDVSQGDLGNCWFVAASSCLAQDKQIWSKVIPDYKEQDWEEEEPEKYAGIFHFNFWRYGEWIDVVIDDFLPTRNGKLIYVHSQSKNEFWSALLEKAYAKINGCYEALDGGELAEALEDFTGGVAEPVDLTVGDYDSDEEKRDQLFKTMKSAMENRAIMASAIPARSSDEMEQAIDCGLVKGHAYGITAVKRVALEGTGLFGIFLQDKIQMIRLRNPWGGCEWNGAFSDGSKEWEKIDKHSREKIGLTFEDDGEFWMTFADFCKHFTNLSVCRVVNTSLFSLQKTWHETALHGEWAAPNRNGGCINNKDTFLNNPQVMFDVPEKEDELLVCLTQKAERGKEHGEKLHIGFTVMTVEENRKYRLHRPQEVVMTSPFKNSRSIFVRHTFQKGRFVLIASTFEPGMTGSFLFRVYSSDSNKAMELLLDKPDKPFFLCACLPCFKYPMVVTKVRVVKATGLEKQDRSGEGTDGDRADPYCYIKCEGENVYTPKCKDTLNPVWDSSAIFYRRDPVNKPIKVQVWNNNVGFDQFMGQHKLQASEECDRKVMEVPLFGRGRDATQPHPGKIVIEVTTSRNLCFM